MRYAEVFFCFPSNRPLSLQVQKRNSFPFRLQTVGEGRKERWVHGVPILYSDPAASSPRHGEPGGGPYHPAGPGTHRKKMVQTPRGRREKKPVWQVFWSSSKTCWWSSSLWLRWISMLSGNAESTIVIFAVLILNAVLGTVQHCKAEKSLESLKAMSAPPPGVPGRRAVDHPLRSDCPRGYRGAGGGGYGGGRRPDPPQLLPEGERELPHRRKRGGGEDRGGH